jgi:hypothetical protein
MRVLTFVTTGLLTAMTAMADSSVGTWRVEWGQAWKVRGDLAKGRDLSGAASFGGDKALVISDETRAAQEVSIDRAARTLTAGKQVPLLPGSGPELDLEGVAALMEPRAYFLVGSQALSRKGGVLEPDRGGLFRLPVDEAGASDAGAVTKIDLRAVLAADAELKPFVDKSADENGLDIEGLAGREGVLFLGLRAPVRDGEATILSMEVDALWGGKAASGGDQTASGGDQTASGGDQTASGSDQTASGSGQATVTHHRIALGEGRGIRDLVALADDAGFLLLAGPSGGGGGGKKSALGEAYEFWHWPGPGSPAVRLGPLGPAATSDQAKAEGLLILSQSSTHIEGIIFHDGPKNGAPHGFRLSPPAPR